METKIKKARLKDRTVTIDFIESQAGEFGVIESKVSKEYGDLVSGDLLRAFENLRKHMVMICDLNGGVLIQELIEMDGHEAVIDEKLLSDIFVTGIVLAGEGESEGAVLIGYKEIGKKVLNLVTPFTAWADTEYPYGDILKTDVMDCIHELQLFMDGKVAVKQLELFPGIEDFDNVNISISTGTGEQKKERKTKKAKPELQIAE